MNLKILRSYNGQNVITLNVIKKSGQNLLAASDKIKAIIDEMKETRLPSNLIIETTGDQSHYTRDTINELNNTIIIGFIFVTIVLMFFMGLVNALFVAFSIPLSMAIAFIFLPVIGFSMNMLVMFSFIFALGIVVDDAIVVIENTHRILRRTGMPIASSAKYAAGEVFMPILSGTTDNPCSVCSSRILAGCCRQIHGIYSDYTYCYTFCFTDSSIYYQSCICGRFYEA